MEQANVLATIGILGFIRYHDMFVPPFMTKIAHWPILLQRASLLKP